MSHTRATEPAMLIRSLEDWADLEVRVKGDEGVVEGIAVPWDRPTRIDSILTEEFARGAFDAQLRRPSSVFLARGHMPFGGSPIGRLVEMRNDSAGLWVSAKVSRTAVGEETLVLLRDGVLDSFSVGFVEGQNAVRQDAALGRVTRRQTAGLREVAIVPNPAYQGAKVLALRGEACPSCSAAQEERQESAEPTAVELALQALDRRPALPLPPRSRRG